MPTTVRSTHLLAAASALVLATAPAAAQTFPAWQSTVKMQLPIYGGPQSFGNYASATSSVRYDPVTKTYTVRDTGSTLKTSAFSPAHKVAAESDARFTVYRKTVGNTTETLRLLNSGPTYSGPANPFITLTYASYGVWRQWTPGAGYNGNTVVADTYFVYGPKTTYADMPKTGGATYSTVLDGTFVNKTTVYSVSGTGTFLADFDSQRINYTASPLGTSPNGPAINFGTVGGAGPLSLTNASFSGKADPLINPTYQMNLNGYLFGPGAAEMGAVFRLSGGGGNGNGAMVGKQP